MSGCELLSFVDGYSGYNQIIMHPKDEEKTTFKGSLANFYYIVMPFGLKNAGVTYQHLMDWIVKKMIDRNVEVYVDDMAWSHLSQFILQLGIFEVGIFELLTDFLHFFSILFNFLLHHTIECQ